MTSVGLQVLDQIANARCVHWISGVEESIEDASQPGIDTSIAFHFSIVQGISANRERTTFRVCIELLFTFLKYIFYTPYTEHIIIIQRL